MPAQECLRFGTRGGDGRLELRDDSTTTNDRVPLTTMLDSVEQIGETPRRFCRSHLNHEFRLSDQLVNELCAPIEVGDHRPAWRTLDLLG